MFGVFSGGEINDDAVALKKLIDLSLSRYASLDESRRRGVIKEDFGDDHFSDDGQNITFVYPELEDFVFCFIKLHSNDDCNELSVFGRAKYEGFHLVSSKSSSWSCSADDGIVNPATGKAKKLAKLFSKKYSITNHSDFLSKFM